MREYYSKIYFHKNKFFTECQSGFLPGDSCISQLLSIVQDINSSFDCDPTIDVRGVFLNISKAFDKVWHDGILLKLETYGVKGRILNLIKKYLYARYQMLVLNGQISSWELVKSGVPQGSVLGPLMSLIYINDFPDNIRSTCKIFADGTSLFSQFLDKDTLQDELNYDLQKVSDWEKKLKVTLSSFNLQQNRSTNFSISRTPRTYIR